MRRWVVSLWGYSLRLHKWLGSDDQRYFHDHAWDFVSLVLRGAYWEIVPHEPMYIWRPAGSIKFYKAEHQHKVFLSSTPCWSLVFSWPKRRNFGFWVNGKLMRPLRYFSRYGVHPCE